MTETRDRHKHDCYVVGDYNYDAKRIIEIDDDACRFVGQLREYDLYVHVRDRRGVECIARFGSDGPDYLSGPGAADLITEFVTGRRRMQTTITAEGVSLTPRPDPRS